MNSQKVLVKVQKKYTLDEVQFHIKEFFTTFGVFDKLKEKKHILIKPNMLGAFSPEKAVTTHPVILEAVINICKEAGLNVIVGDSPGGMVKIHHAWKTTGFLDVCEKTDTQLIDIGKAGILKTGSHHTPLFFDKEIMNDYAIINLAKMKTHGLMLYTGAIKNLYGLIPGLYKSELHKLYPSPEQFTEVLVAIYETMKPRIAINIIDGIIGMDGEGPSGGKPNNFGFLLASDSATAVDCIASQMMGYELEQIKYLVECLKLDDLSKKNIEVEDKYQNYVIPDVDLKSVKFTSSIVNKLPKFLTKLFRQIFSFYPGFLPHCHKCSICVIGCPVKALSLKKGKAIQLDKSKCIKCLCCHELCPHKAVYLKKNIIAKFILKSR